MKFKDWLDAETTGTANKGEVELAKRAWDAALENQWLPIETAPKEGKNVLVCNIGMNNTGESFYWEGAWRCWDGENHVRTYYLNPTHWMPMPEPPK